ncbi:GNAT family N-acetyltransferase [Spirillospora sp. CA-128828]|uniref:GNAT family N-acetyltransferase n=1 Tax=Spirillospora sp. CA-128828 TaxID=3240033 RepID=UPI003D8F2C7D
MEDVMRLDGPAARRIGEEIAGLYRRCYAAPPWSETSARLADYPGKLAASTERPGFGAWIVRDGGRLAGVCYGWPTPSDLSGNRIYTTLVRAAGAEDAAALTRGAFEVAELFVHPAHQGRGLGRTLLTGAVAGWDTAWLITHPGAPAARLYQRLGWRRAVALPADFYPQLPMSVYTLGRTGPSTAARETQAELDPL